MVRFGQMLHIASLPGVGPSPVESAHRIGIGAAEEDPRVRGQRKHLVFILEQDLAFHRCLIGLSGELFAAEQRILRLRGFLVEQAHPVLEPEDAPDGIVDTLHRNNPLIHQFLQQRTVFQRRGDHNHVNSRIHRKADALLDGRNHLEQAIQFLYVRPVGNDDTIPVQTLLEPVGNEFTVAHTRDAVHHRRVRHHGEDSVERRLAERLEMLLLQVFRRNGGRGTVYAAVRGAVAEVMLQAGRHVISVNMVRIRALQAGNVSPRHNRGQVGIFSPGLVETRPGRLYTEVHAGSETPAYATGAGLIRIHFPQLLHERGVEGRRHAQLLREHSSAGNVRRSMHLVQSVDQGDTVVTERGLLHLGDGSLPDVEPRSIHAAEHVDEGSDVVLSEHRFHLFLVRDEILRGRQIHRQQIEGVHRGEVVRIQVPDHFLRMVAAAESGLLYQSPQFIRPIAHQCGKFILRMIIGDLVDFQLDDLTDLLVEGHPGKGLFKLLLQLVVCSAEARNQQQRKRGQAENLLHHLI